jgi:hypothetical protein
MSVMVSVLNDIVEVENDQWPPVKIDYFIVVKGG